MTRAVRPEHRPIASLLTALLLCAACAGRLQGDEPVTPATRDPTPLAASSATAGLDLFQRRAVTESWDLHHLSEYRHVSPSDHEQRARAAIRQALIQRRADDVEVAVDLDEDGRGDYWVYFAESEPHFVETDRFDTGVHDLRYDLRSTPWQVNKYAGWTLEPPVTLPGNSLPSVGLESLFERTVPAADTDADLAPGRYRLACGVWDDPEEMLGRLAGATEHEELGRQLESFRKRAVARYARYTERFRSEKLAEKLKIYKGFSIHTVAYDEDGEEGKEFAVAYAPWGVDGMQFFERQWKPLVDEVRGRFGRAEGFQAEVGFDRQGRVRHIDLGADRYLAIGRFWAKVGPGGRRRIGERLLLPGYRSYREDDWYAALARWRRAVDLAALLGDLRVDATGKPAGSVTKDQWEFALGGDDAGTILDMAHALASRRNFPGFAVLAGARAERRDFEGALDLYRLGLRMADKAAEPVTRVGLLEKMAAIYQRSGNYDRALECLFESIDVEATLGYYRGVIENVRTLAQTVDAEAMDRTLEVHSHAMAVGRCAKLGSIAALYADLGESRKAESYLAEAERISSGIGHKYLEADLLNVRARLDLGSGQYELARRRLNRALSLTAEEMARQRQHRETQDLYEAGRSAHTFPVRRPRRVFLVTMVGETDPRCYQALTATLLAETHARRAQAEHEGRRQDLQAASEWLQKAQAWYAEAGDAEGLLAVRVQQATVLLASGNATAALQLARSVAADSLRHEAFETRWRGLALEGACCRAVGNVPEAIGALERAAEAIESQRARIQSEPVRRSFFSSKVQVYQQLAELYLESNAQPLRAWQCMERAKARTLLDIVGGESLALKGREVTEARRQFPLLWAQFTAGGERALPDSPERSPSPALWQSIADRPLLQELASLGSVPPVDLQAVSDVLEPDIVLLEYLVGPEHTLAAIIHNGKLRVRRLERDGEQSIRRQVEQFRSLLERGGDDYEPLARSLYQRLVAPCLDGLADVRRLCIVPGGPLHYLPFNALVGPDGRFLLERAEVFHAPSAGALVYAAHRRSALRGKQHGSSDPARRGQTLVVADPRPRADFSALPYAALEGRSIHDLARDPRRELQGRRATESRVIEQLPKTRYFHFAGHTHLPSSMPLRAALLCTEDLERDGRLEVREIFGLHLPQCELAVLSACETRLGRWSRGDEIVGLERAFLRAGVPTVVTSLWKVDDAATQALMTDFYRRLWNDPPGDPAGVDEAGSSELTGGRQLAALRAAQLALLRGELAAQVQEAERTLGAARPLPEEGREQLSSRHPRFWAPFVLSGAP